MISVSIAINGEPIYCRSAVNITQEEGGVYGKDKQFYRLDTGEKITNYYGDGAVKLAIKMLKTIKEV